MINKIKFTLPLTEKTHTLIKQEAEEMGVSMASYINHVLATHMNTKGKLMNSITDSLQKVIDEASKKNTE